jgi:putative transcriptional regulator
MIAAANEGVAIARGEADPKTFKVNVLASVDVKAVRTRLRLTQQA